MFSASDEFPIQLK